MWVYMPMLFLVRFLSQLGISLPCPAQCYWQALLELSSLLIYWMADDTNYTLPFNKPISRNGVCSVSNADGQPDVDDVGWSYEIDECMNYA